VIRRALLVLSAAALAAQACQSKPSDRVPAPRATPSGSARRARVGLATPAATRDFLMTAESVQRCPAGRLHPASAGHYVLGVSVHIEALSNVGVPVNPFYARLGDADGASYRARLGGCKPALGGPPLTAHQSARGFVSFEIPDKASELELRYAPELPNAPGEELDFALGR
jgi:hypothetical protein